MNIDQFSQQPDLKLSVHEADNESDYHFITFNQETADNLLTVLLTWDPDLELYYLQNDNGDISTVMFRTIFDAVYFLKNVPADADEIGYSMSVPMPSKDDILEF